MLLQSDLAIDEYCLLLDVNLRKDDRILMLLGVVLDAQGEPLILAVGKYITAERRRFISKANVRKTTGKAVSTCHAKMSSRSGLLGLESGRSSSKYAEHEKPR